jgi:hypothetical protein
MVVLFETIIYPFFKVCIPSMLKRIGLGMGVAIVGLLVLFVTDVYGYNQKLTHHFSNVSELDNCYLVNDSLEEDVNISAHALSIIMLIAALAEALVFIASKA